MVIRFVIPIHPDAGAGAFNERVANFRNHFKNLKFLMVVIVVTTAVAMVCLGMSSSRNTNLAKVGLAAACLTTAGAIYACIRTRQVQLEYQNLRREATAIQDISPSAQQFLARRLI